MTKKSSQNPPDLQDTLFAFFDTPAQGQSPSNSHQTPDIFFLQPPKPRLPRPNSIRMAILGRLIKRLKRQVSESAERDRENAHRPPNDNIAPLIIVDPPKKATTTNRAKASGSGSGSGGGSVGSSPYNSFAVNSLLTTSLNPDTSYSSGYHDISRNRGSGSRSHTYSGGGSGGYSSHSSGGDGGSSWYSSGGDGGGSSSCGGGGGGGGGGC
ncbi:hypothetical protein TWF481_001240 [Arthrobotrys musiformis]|uniref:Uncharacterized protein n=1 Tax=Arthrobotrys musiformis TaxID=47236 RepID=A0AAV9WS26_9PEZI